MNNMFKKYIKKYLWIVILCFIFAIGFVMAQLFIPIVTGQAIDLMVEGEAFNNDIVSKILIITILVVLNFLFQYLFDLMSSMLNQNIIYEIRMDLFKKYNFVPVSYLDSKLKGDLVLRSVNDVENISTGLLGGVRQLYQGIVMIIGTLCFMFSVNWFLGFVVIIITPLSIFTARFIAKKCTKYFKKQAGFAGELSGKSFEAINNRDMILAYNYDKELIEKYKNKNQELYKVGQKAQFYSTWINPTTRFINNLTYASVLIVGAILIINGDFLTKIGLATFSVGALQSILVYANQYAKPFNEISSVMTEIQSASASLKRIDKILSEPNSIDKGEKELGSAEILKFNNVSFSYDDSKKIIDNVSFDINKNEKIAIVGPTGCGKTTLINLIMRFYEIDSGSITINGIDIRDITKKNLRSHFGMVLQDTWIFNGTILDNIRYVKPDATLEEVIDAAQKAHAHKFIMKYKDNYNTVISSNSGLSEGEKQLICIARVILANPEIVILDEATSNIDTRTERRVQKGFDELLNGKTSIVIAHRLSTIVNSDRIIVMKKGKIIEMGKHKDLIKQKGFYNELYNSQYEN